MTTPMEAWDILRLGDERFIAGEPRHPHQDADRRSELAHSQTPIATVFGCSDSRLAAEIIFDLGIGDAFVVRNAGQVVTPSELGSLEYAVGVLNIPLLLVLGHDECGAVRAAIDAEASGAAPLPPHISRLISPIAQAVRRVAVVGGEFDPSLANATEVGREHLRDTIANLLHASEMISDAVADGRLAIVGANYRLEEGRAVPDILIGLD